MRARLRGFGISVLIIAAAVGALSMPVQAEHVPASYGSQS
jgi:hypothetical protein